MILAITIGHAGRASRPQDRGAVCEGVEEVSVVRTYTDLLDRELRKRGHTVYLLSDGSYSEQWARADAYKADIYLNCHVNAGGGDRGEFFYDHRSTKGKALAEAIANRVARLGWNCYAKACKPDDDGEPRDEDYSEAFGCIAGVKAVALCVEPYFLDGPRRGQFLSHLKELAEALANGVGDFDIKSRSGT